LRRRYSLALLLVLSAGMIAGPGSASIAVWSNRFGTGGGDYIAASARDTSGGIVVAGVTWGALAGPRNVAPSGFVRRYSAAGRVLWTRQISGPSFSTVQAVTVRTDGRVDALMNTFVQGRMGSVVSTVLAFDAGGRLLRQRRVGPPMSTYPEAVADGSGGVIMISGTYRQVRPGEHERFLRRYNASGTLLWNVPIPRDEAWSGPVRDRGGFVVHGSRRDADGEKWMVAAFDLNGRRRWTREGPDGQLWQLASDGSTIAGLGARESKGGMEWVVSTWDTDGRPDWTRYVRSIGDQEAPAPNVIAVSKGVVAVAGEVREKSTSVASTQRRLAGPRALREPLDNTVPAQLRGTAASRGSTLFARVFDAGGATSWHGTFPGRDQASLAFVTLHGRSLIMGGAVHTETNGTQLNADAYLAAVNVPGCSSSSSLMRDETGCRQEDETTAARLP